MVKKKTEAQAIFLNPFTVCSSGKQIYVHKSMPFRAKCPYYTDEKLDKSIIYL